MLQTINKNVFMKKYLLRFGLGLLVLGFGGGFYVWKYVYNKPHPDYISMKPDVSLTAQALFEQFVADQPTSNQKYIGKVVEIEGVPARLETADSLRIVVFVFRQGDFGDEGIRCSLHPEALVPPAGLPAGKTIRLKGYLTGFNGSDVVMEKCSYVE